MLQKTIVFDFGGVLFKTSFESFYRERFQAQGRDEKEIDFFLSHVFTNEELSRSNGGNVRDLVAQKVQHHPAWADDIRAYAEEAGFLKTIRGVVPEMESVLADISAAGHCIVGLTNWHGDTYDYLPKAFPAILKWFSTVIVSGKIGLRKPDPEIFRRAHRAYGAPDPAQVYYFDDKPANTEGARQAVGWHAFPFEDAATVRRALALAAKRE